MNFTLAHSGIIGPLGRLWAAGAQLRVQLYETGLLRQHRLRTSVISIGNISWGGTGKTPFTIWLAERLQARGLRVSILTRGYGRTSTERVKILSPGTPPESATADGDEVQLYLRHLKVPVGISASRYEAGKLLEQSFPVDVHLLDDGFQHLPLARDIDLVLVDASSFRRSTNGRNIWSNLLREGPAALRRAHAIILTRCESSGESTENLKAIMRRLNPDAPCFAVTTRLLHFAAAEGANSPPAIFPVNDFVGQLSFAFCGLGNPDNFLGMLERAGTQIAGKKVFPDHHRYTTNDVAAITKSARDLGAERVITTEKDVVNLPADGARSLPLYWAVIEPTIEDEHCLLEWICEELRRASSSSHDRAAATAADREGAVT
jgi:tetraacyldisaccharide 4'-kinase